MSEPEKSFYRQASEACAVAAVFTAAIIAIAAVTSPQRVRVGLPLDAASVSRHGNGWVSFELTLRGETRRYLWHPTEPFVEVGAGEGEQGEGEQGE